MKGPIWQQFLFASGLMVPVGIRSGILMLWARIVSSFQLSRPLLKSFRASKSQKVHVGAAPLDISGGSADPSDLPGCATDWSYF